MTQERKYLDTALEAGQYALTALDAAVDALLMKEERDLVLATHEALHKVYEAREALEVALGALKRLERLHRVERLERRGEER
jgi:ribulose 1,5-bisphosphate carboxylase large subunit-like protein